MFTVPPFQGAIDIVCAALIGEGVFPNVKAKIRKLIRTFPGALELLPNYAGASRFDACGSIRRVQRLVPETDSRTGLPYWQAQ